MDVELLRSIYQQYAKEIYVYLLALSKDSALSEDILQEVFCKAICSLPDSHTNIRAWIYKVARNLYFNEAKKMKRQVPLEEIRDVPENAASDTLLDHLLQTEENRLLYQAIRQLPDRQRRILILQYFSGMSVKEIAVTLGESPENVRVLSHRGRKQLKQYMEVNGYEIS